MCRKTIPERIDLTGSRMEIEYEDVILQKLIKKTESKLILNSVNNFSRNN